MSPKTVFVPAMLLVAVFFLSVAQPFALQATAATNNPAPLATQVNQQTPAAYEVEPPLACYGPCITANISKVDVYLGESVTVWGEISPPDANFTIRVTFTRPDYTWIDRNVTTDAQGRFSVTQTLDMVGYWNIFPIRDHISDRLYANVTDPNNPLAPQPTPLPLPPFKPNYLIFALAAISLSVGVVAIAAGARNKTRTISGIRLFVQIAFIFLIFFGVFVDHQNLPIPAEQIATHEYLIGAEAFGDLPDGLPLPVFGCWFPCGRTVTCPLWELQAYIYPFWDAGRGWGVDYLMSGAERLAIVVGLVVVASVLLGRFWCGWICPFGLYVDLITRLRKALQIRHRRFSPKFNERFHQLSYVILAAMLILSVLFASQSLFGTQLIPETEKGGFIYTYFAAPFCQVCPMKPLCVFSQAYTGVMRPDWIFSPTTGDFLQLGQYVTSLNVSILILVTIAAFFFRRSWCRICPLGGLIALFNRFAPFKWVSGVRLEKTAEKCTKCGICKRVCPTEVTEVYELKGGDVATSQCIMCLRCVEMCPYEDCLQFKVLGKTVAKSRNWLNNKSNDKPNQPEEAA
ncbi:MAG: 4Fe-4S binding protein [Candidatus Bathyarchaeota archaeon]|nr:4Fe-4S binding protein [Candidatus Bathyarchaeota archaeon]